ncbi:hypothetical protein DTO166G4_9071 [Paecilomyces variotii]|nr:hypothetical protein DTO166G4_9071 [Paecilomyces variotii]KAJ9242585.1 hypothetical protein DTO166G5_340 [Paecilomyces variotii]
MRFADTRQERVELIKKIERLDEELKKLRLDHDEVLAEHREAIAGHREAIQRIEDITGGVGELRNLFFDVYKKNQMDQEKRLNALHWSDNPWIRKTEQTVERDCKRDAELPYYRHIGMKRYRELYGFFPKQVLTIEYEPTIRTLNKHASILSSPFMKTSPRFDELWRHFIDTLAESDYPERYEANPYSRITQAYRAFWGCLDYEVAEVERVDIDEKDQRLSNLNPRRTWYQIV